MCYLPLPILKIIVGTGAGASILLSIGMLAAVIYVNFQHKDIIDNANEPVIKTLFVFFYIFSILFLLLSLCGLYGSIKARRKNKLAPCLLSAYLIAVVVFFFIFLGLTIIMFAAPPSVFGQSCKQGSATKLVEDLYNLNEKAKNNFCTASCPCFLNSTNQKSELVDWLKTNNRLDYDKNTSNLNYRSCLTQTVDIQNGLLMGTLEDFLDCGGWCAVDNVPKFLRFSDINKCVKSGTYRQSLDCYNQKPACYEQFKNFLVSKGTTMGIASSIATAIVLVNMIFVCCICCHPNTRAQKNKNFYARMMESE